MSDDCLYAFMDTFKSITLRAIEKSDTKERVKGIIELHQFYNRYIQVMTDYLMKDRYCCTQEPRSVWMSFVIIVFGKSIDETKQIIKLKPKAVCDSDRFQCIEELSRSQALSGAILKKYLPHVEVVLLQNNHQTNPMFDDQRREQVQQYLDACA